MNNELENFIRRNLDGLDRKRPNAAVLSRILKEMKSKKNGRPGDIVIPFRLMKWAAASLFFAACLIGLWYVKNQKPTIQVTKITVPKKQTLQQPVADAIKDTTVYVADKRNFIPKKAFVDKVKAEQVVSVVSFTGLNDMQSAASRISDVASVSKQKHNGNDVVDALVQIIDNDPNTNVRLAALDGLTRFYREAYMRKKLVASLKKQHDPVMQVNLIALLVRMREFSILSDLVIIINDEKTDKTVKDLAYSGIMQLRPGIIN